MNFACPKCQQVINLRSKTCPGCGFPLTLRAVVMFYWKKQRKQYWHPIQVKCPSCGQPSSTTESHCLLCGAPITFDAAVHSVVDPPRRRWREMIANVTPQTGRRAQWLYFLLSLFFLWWLSAYVEEKQRDQWWKYAFLTAIFLAVGGLVTVFVLPRSLVQTIARRFSRLMKLAFISNFLSCVLVVQILIGAWWARALVLAGLMGTVYLAVYILCQLLWPGTQAVRSVYDEAQESGKPFNPSNPQGRHGRID